MHSLFYILQLVWDKIKDPKTVEYIGKLKQNLLNIGTGLQDSLKGVQTTVENTKDIMDDFKESEPKEESKKDKTEDKE